MRKINVGYLRVSSSQQDYAHQKQSILNYCKTKDTVIDLWIDDDGISAFSTDMTDRAGLMELLRLSAEGKIDTLYIFESSRLSRNHLQTLTIISELTSYNVKIYSVTEGLVNDNSDISTLLQSIKAWNNEQESRKMSTRIRSSKNLIAKNNGFMGGTVLYGYKREGNKLVVDVDKKPIIKEMFNIYLLEGSKATMEYLKNNGYNIKTRSVLMQLLTNTTYKGYYYKSEGNKHIYIKDLDIIGQEVFDKVQVVMKQRSTQKNKVAITNKTNYLCEGILFCSKCGKKLYINTSQNGSSMSYRANCNCLSQKNFSIKKLDDIVSERVGVWYSGLDINVLKDKFEVHRDKEYKLLKSKEKQLSSLLNTKKQTLTNAKKKLQQSILLDVGLETITVLSKSISELETSVSSLEKQIESVAEEIEQEQLLISKDIEISKKLLDYSVLYEYATVTEKKQLVRTVANKILITSWDDIKIEWKY